MEPSKQAVIRDDSPEALPGMTSLMPKPKILVIEDERSLVEVLSYNLEREGFEVARRARRPGGPAAGAIEAAGPGRAGLDATTQAGP